MNKEYAYIDGKALITDTKGNQKLEEYYEDLNKVLVQENLVEEMENQITELTKEQNIQNVRTRKHYIPIVLPALAFISTVGANLIFYFYTGINPLTEQVNTIFGTLNFATYWSLAFSSILIPIGAISEYFIYKTYKEAKKDQNGTNKELEYLKNQIIKEKQVLEELKKAKKNSNKLEEVKIIQIDDKKQLEELKNNLEYYYNLGYNEEENLEEQGPKLIRRKN